MPLAFSSLNRGKIAFGFFNIFSDMLLLEEQFFFATDFCQALVQISRRETDDRVLTHEIPAFVIPRGEDVGDLMGAIHGVRFTGFIGESYQRYPFPAERDQFKQRPEGFETRTEFETMIRKYGRTGSLPMDARAESLCIALGDYQFERSEFARLVEYVWQGGYPRWKDEERPDYVTEMARSLRESDCWIFAGVRFD